VGPGQSPLILSLPHLLLYLLVSFPSRLIYCSVILKMFLYLFVMTHDSLSCNSLSNKKHLKNVGPIRHCEPPHALILHCHSPGVTTVARRHCCMPPAHRCPQHQRQQQQRVTEGPLWPHRMGPITVNRLNL